MQADYVVIGGGHNGLVAANYLAKAGRSVIVLERRPYLGGLGATHSHVAAAPDHRLSRGAIDSVFIKTTSIIEDLSLDQHGLSFTEIDPSYGWIDEDGETLCIFKSVERTADDIARFSKRDAATYRTLQSVFITLLDTQSHFFNKDCTDIGALDFAKAVLHLGLDREARRLITRLISCSAYEAIADTFESDQLRSLYAYWVEIACPSSVDGAGVYLGSLAAIHKVGCNRPLGGMGGLIGALERKLQSAGGIVKLESTVRNILVENGRASGVVLADGTSIAASRGVLASCAPQLTYGRLLPPEVLDRGRAKVAFMPANVTNMCPFKVDMALQGRIGLLKAQARRKKLDGVDIGAASLMTGSFADHVNQAAAHARGEQPASSPIWMTILSHADRTIAPPDDSVLYLHTHVPSQSALEWEAQAGARADRVVSEAAKYISGLEREIGRCVTTPADFEQDYGTPRGCLYHVDMLPSRLGGNRPAGGLGGSRTELAGLYLAGSGSHPGGGIFGMPGKLAASAALKSRG